MLTKTSAMLQAILIDDEPECLHTLAADIDQYCAGVKGNCPLQFAQGRNQNDQPAPARSGIFRYRYAFYQWL